MGNRWEIITSDLITRALEEDIGSGDVTTDATVPHDMVSTAFLFSKARGVLAGIEVASKVFRRVDPALEVKTFYTDGQDIREGHKVAEITGSVASILKAERTALNFLGRMSGIATRTRHFVQLVNGCNVKILDTRKTMPLFRHLDKYSVKTGGGSNHRFGLYDMVLIKDNHIAVAGCIRIAVERVVEKLRETGKTMKIEVECKSYEEVLEAVYTPVDIIMLDNMDVHDIETSVKSVRDISIEIGRKIRVEVSGNITEKNVREVADTGVDYISIGALTHSVVNHDFSLLFVEL